MKKTIKTAIMAPTGLLILSVLCVSATVLAQEKAKKQVVSKPCPRRVLLVHSYGREYPWSSAITQGVREGFKGAKVELLVFYMDTKHHSDPASCRQAGKQARQLVEKFKPSVIIASDDNAQAYFAKSYAGKKKGPQVVFCGVNADPAIYGYPADNVTGILERPFYVQTLAWLKTLRPKVNRVAFLTDGSVTSKLMIEHLKKQQTPLEIVSFDQADTFAEWKALLKKNEQTVDAVMIGLYQTVKKSSSGNQGRMAPKSVMAWTIAHTSKPTASVFKFAIVDGVLCGVVESGRDHGLEVSGLALKILKGDRAGELPTRTARVSRKLINIRTARLLGLRIPSAQLNAADKILGK